MTDYIVRKIGYELDYRFQGTLWIIGVPPLFCGLCDVFQPREGDDVIVTLMCDTRDYKARALRAHIEAGYKFILSTGRHDIYIQEEVYPYRLRFKKMTCPFPWDDPLLILRFEQAKAAFDG